MRKEFLLATVMACSAAQAHATPVTINFDSFVDASNINGLDLGGVTVTSPTSGHVDIYANRFGVGSRSGSNAIGSFTGSASNNPMVFTFDAAVSFVQLFAGDAGGIGGDLDQWEMRVFDAAAGGNLLASLLSPITHGSPYSGLSYAGTGIMRIETYWTAPGCCGIGFDDLTFDTSATTPPPPPPPAVPLPASGVALSGVLAMLAGLRRLRRR